MIFNIMERFNIVDMEKEKNRETSSKSKAIVK